MSSYYYPRAGNLVYLKMKEESGNRIQKEYREVAGWISSNSQNMFPSTSYSTPEVIGLYSSDREAASFALTNGVLWKYVSGSRETYICPEHAKQMGKHGITVNWSYLMNAYFGWNKKGRAASNIDSGRIEYGRLAKSDKTLLFSDSLDFERATKIYEHFKGQAKVAFGIGTFIANDTNVPALNIVCKVIECNGMPVAKLSDVEGKGMCLDNEYIEYLKRTIAWRLEKTND